MVFYNIMIIFGIIMLIPQPLMLSTCVLIPLITIYHLKRHDLAVSWLALISILDIFNSQLYMNLSAILIFGMVAAPYLFMERKKVLKLNSIYWFCFYFLILIMLGAYHGFISPWPDPTAHRSFKDQAQIRTILHLGRTFCEWSSLLYLSIQLSPSSVEIIKKYLKVIFFGSLLLCLGSMLEENLHFDFYHFFTGGRELLMKDRFRGFDYEPRGISQNIAISLVMLYFVPFGNWKFLAIPLFIFYGFYKTYSFSGFFVLATGITVLFLGQFKSLFYVIKINRIKSLFAIASIIAMFFFSINQLPDAAKNYMKLRLDLITSTGIAEKLEVFDAASINFLNHQPKYYGLGTGPGLVYLPAGDYILDRDKEIWQNGFEALPHMGIVLLIANSGLIGLSIYLFALFNAVRNKRKQNQVYLVLAIALVAIQMIQLRYMTMLGFAYLLSNKVEKELNA